MLSWDQEETMADSDRPRRTPRNPESKARPEGREELRAMLSVQPSTRDRFNRLTLLLSAATEQRLTADDTLIWLMDQLEPNIRTRLREALDNAPE